MDENSELAAEFEANRPRLRGVAYRMLGSLAEADDAVQEAWLRLNRSDAAEIDNLGGWLTTVVARVSLDMLRPRKSRGEEPLGAHVPEPIVGHADARRPRARGAARRLRGARAAGGARDAEARPSGSRSCCTTCSRVPFDEIAPIVDRSPDARAQLASRARRRVQGRAPVPDAGPRPSARGRRRLPRGRARRATSRRCSRCSTPTSCCAPTRGARPASAEVRGAHAVAERALTFSHLALDARTGARQRRRRALVTMPRRRAVLGDGLHRRGREDRRDRHPRRPRAPARARPHRPRRLTGLQAQTGHEPPVIAVLVGDNLDRPEAELAEQSPGRPGLVAAEFEQQPSAGA